MMIAKCAVTFEYDRRPPQTWRGDVAGRRAATLMYRAITAATNVIHPTQWTSVVCCILEISRTRAIEEMPSSVGADAK